VLNELTEFRLFVTVNEDSRAAAKTGSIDAIALIFIAQASRLTPSLAAYLS
jgi:hypothetical protein